MNTSTTRIPGARCTNCRRMVTAATNVVDDRSPDPGDATVCIMCGHLMIFTKALQLRDPTDEEILQFAGDPRILRAQQIKKGYDEDQRAAARAKRASKRLVPATAPRSTDRR